MKTTIGGIDVGDSQVRSALKYSLLDACFWQIMFVLVENFAVAAALSLKAPSIAISLLGPLPLFIGAFGQMFALRCVNPSCPRKSYMIVGTRIQTVCIVLAAVAGFLPRPTSIVVFATAYALYVISGKLFDNLWQTWFSDLVPSAIMGRHMAWRNTILSSLGLFASLIVVLSPENIQMIIRRGSFSVRFLQSQR